MKSESFDKENAEKGAREALPHPPPATGHPPLATTHPPLAPTRSRLKKWLLEPLLHFFLLGVAVFGLHAALDRKANTPVKDPYQVEVSSVDIEWMHTLFEKQMGRIPTVQELRGQVNQMIREQILSREAVALGLDEGDLVVRRRLAQKMEFFFKDLSAMNEPTEDELRQYFAENAGKYEIPARVTFTQVYFSVDGRGVDGAKEAAQKLIEAGGDPNSAAARGDTSMLSPECNQCSEIEIGGRFGPDFAEAVMQLEPGVWHGPVKSAYGSHAVYIHERLAARLPDFQAILNRIKTDRILAKREENSRKVYGEIRSRYRVLVEGLPYDSDWKGKR